MRSVADRKTSMVLVAAIAAIVAARPTTARADEVTVPIPLQVQLLGRVASYDRNFTSHAGEVAKVLVVERRGHAESSRTGSQLTAAMRRVADFAGRPLEITTHVFTTASALREAVDSAGTAIVYLTPGLGGDTAAIAAGLAGSPVISVSAVSGDVERGAVVGFELVETRPKLVVNLRQARLQRVTFSSQFLRIARVIS